MPIDDLSKMTGGKGAVPDFFPKKVESAAKSMDNFSNATTKAATSSKKLDRANKNANSSTSTLEKTVKRLERLFSSGFLVSAAKDMDKFGGSSKKASDDIKSVESSVTSLKRSLSSIKGEAEGASSALNLMGKKADVKVSSSAADEVRSTTEEVKKASASKIATLLADRNRVNAINVSEIKSAQDKVKKITTIEEKARQSMIASSGKAQAKANELAVAQASLARESVNMSDEDVRASKRRIESLEEEVGKLGKVADDKKNLYKSVSDKQKQSFAEAEAARQKAVSVEVSSLRSVLAEKKRLIVQGEKERIAAATSTAKKSGKDGAAIDAIKQTEKAKTVALLDGLRTREKLVDDYESKEVSAEKRRAKSILAIRAKQKKDSDDLATAEKESQKARAEFMKDAEPNDWTSMKDAIKITDVLTNKLKEGGAQANSFMNNFGGAKAFGMAAAAAGVLYLTQKLADLYKQLKENIVKFSEFNVSMSTIAKTSLVAPGGIAQLTEMRDQLGMNRQQFESYADTLRKGANLGIKSVGDLHAAAMSLQETFGGDPRKKLEEFIGLLEKIPTIETDLSITANLDDQAAAWFAIAEQGKVESVIELQAAGLMGGIKEEGFAPQKDVDSKNIAMRTEKRLEDIHATMLSAFPELILKMGGVAAAATKILGVMSAGFLAVGALKSFIARSLYIKTRTTAMRTTSMDVTLAQMNSRQTGQSFTKGRGQRSGGKMLRGMKTRGRKIARKVLGRKRGQSLVKFLKGRSGSLKQGVKGGLIGAAVAIAGKSLMSFGDKLEESGKMVAGGAAKATGGFASAAGTMFGLASAGAALGGPFGAIAGAVVGAATAFDDFALGVSSLGKSLQGEVETATGSVKKFNPAIVKAGELMQNWGNDTAAGMGMVSSGISNIFSEIGKDIGDAFTSDEYKKAMADQADAQKAESFARIGLIKIQKENQKSMLSLQKHLKSIDAVASGAATKLYKLEAQSALAALSLGSLAGGSIDTFNASINKASSAMSSEFEKMSSMLKDRRKEIMKDSDMNANARRVALTKLHQVELDAAKSFVEGMINLSGQFDQIPVVAMNALQNKISNIRLDFQIDTGSQTASQIFDELDQQFSRAFNSLGASASAYADDLDRSTKIRHEVEKKNASIKDDLKSAAAGFAKTKFGEKFEKAISGKDVDIKALQSMVAEVAPEMAKLEKKQEARGKDVGLMGELDQLGSEREKKQKEYDNLGEKVKSTKKTMSGKQGVGDDYKAMIKVTDLRMQMLKGEISKSDYRKKTFGSDVDSKTRSAAITVNNSAYKGNIEALGGVKSKYESRLKIHEGSREYTQAREASTGAGVDYSSAKDDLGKNRSKQIAVLQQMYDKVKKSGKGINADLAKEIESSGGIFKKREEIRRLYAGYIKTGEKISNQDRARLNQLQELKNSADSASQIRNAANAALRAEEKATRAFYEHLGNIVSIIRKSVGQLEGGIGMARVKGIQSTISAQSDFAFELGVGFQNVAAGIDAASQYSDLAAKNIEMLTANTNKIRDRLKDDTKIGKALAGDSQKAVGVLKKEFGDLVSPTTMKDLESKVAEYASTVSKGLDVGKVTKEVQDLVKKAEQEAIAGTSDKDKIANVKTVSSRLGGAVQSVEDYKRGALAEIERADDKMSQFAAESVSRLFKSYQSLGDIPEKVGKDIKIQTSESLGQKAAAEAELAAEGLDWSKLGQATSAGIASARKTLERKTKLIEESMENLPSQLAKSADGFRKQIEVSTQRAAMLRGRASEAAKAGTPEGMAEAASLNNQANAAERTSAASKAALKDIESGAALERNMAKHEEALAKNEVDHKKRVVDLAKQELEAKMQMIDAEQGVVDDMASFVADIGGSFHTVHRLTLESVRLETQKLSAMQDTYGKLKTAEEDRVKDYMSQGKTAEEARGLYARELRMQEFGIVKQQIAVQRKVMGAQRDSYEKLLNLALGEIRGARGARKHMTSLERFAGTGVVLNKAGMPMQGKAKKFDEAVYERRMAAGNMGGGMPEAIAGTPAERMGFEGLGRRGKVGGVGKPMGPDDFRRGGSGSGPAGSGYTSLPGVESPNSSQSITVNVKGKAELLVKFDAESLKQRVVDIVFSQDVIGFFDSKYVRS